MNGDQGWARAKGVRSVMEGTYADPKLHAAPIRPGSTAAREIPSRVGTQLRYRDGRITDLQGVEIQAAASPPAVAPQTPAPVAPRTAPAAPRPAASPLSRMAHPSLPSPVVRRFESNDFAPRSDSVVARAIAYLNGKPAGTLLTAVQLRDEFDMAPTSYYGLFKRAWETKALLRLIVDGRAAVALPSYDQVASAPATAAPPAVERDADIRQFAGRSVISDGAFSASLWADDELEISGLDETTRGFIRLDANQTRQLARLLRSRGQLLEAAQ